MTVRMDPAIDVDALRKKFDAAVQTGRATEEHRAQFEAAIKTPEFVNLLGAAQVASDAMGRKAAASEPQQPAPEGLTYWGGPEGDDGREAFIPTPAVDGYSDPSEDTPAEWERHRTHGTLHKAAHVLSEAEHIVTGGREEDYGENSLPQTAAIWSAYLGVDITGRDVANMMIQLKTVRDKHKAKHDNVLDIIGYAVLSEHLTFL